MRLERPLDLGVIKEHIEKHARDHVIFMDLVSSVLGKGTTEYMLVEKAALSIINDFKGVRRHTGEEYVVHQRSVAVIGMMYSDIKDHRLIAADILHDTPEDVEEVTFSDIRKQYGKKVAHIVQGMTKPELPEKGKLSQQQYDEICGQIIFAHVQKFGPECVQGKCRDRLHNMFTLWGDSSKKLRKISETVQFVLPISIHANYLWRELTMATSEQLARLHVDDTQS